MDQNGNEWVLRYSRQLILEEIGAEGQEKLCRARVLVVGAGGLGSPVLYYLVAAGVGTLGIVDFDTVGISNLQRQILHTTGDIGRRKTDSAEDRLRALNPDVRIKKYPVRLHVDNAMEILAEYDVVVDAVDNFPARVLINDACHFLGKPLVIGAVLGFDGILFSVIPGQTPCYRCLYPKVPEDGVIPSCADTGVVGMAVGTIGSLQALEVLKLLLGTGRPLTGRMLVFEGLRSSFREVTLDRRTDCVLCGDSPTIRELEEIRFQCKNKHTR